MKHTGGGIPNPLRGDKVPKPSTRETKEDRTFFARYGTPASVKTESGSTREVIAAAILALTDDALAGDGEKMDARDALQALLDKGLAIDMRDSYLLGVEVGREDGGLDEERDAAYELGQKVGRTDGIEEMRERCAKEAEAMSEHADLNNLSGQCAATLIADEIRDLSLREES